MNRLRQAALPHLRVLDEVVVDRGDLVPVMPAAQRLEGQEHWARCVDGFTRMDTPVVAAVNGAAAGAGFGLALAADVRVASTPARFNAAFVRIGLTGSTRWTGHDSRRWVTSLEVGSPVPYPDRAALVGGDTRLTFAEFDVLVDAVAGALAA